MQYMIKIKTPAGEATKTSKKLDAPILGVVSKIKLETFINKDESQFVWVVKSNPKTYIKIKDNVLKFQVMASKLLTTGVVKKQLKKAGSKEDYKLLLDCFKNGMSIDIKHMTDEELEEMNKGSIFTKIINKIPFKKGD